MTTPDTSKKSWKAKLISRMREAQPKPALAIESLGNATALYHYTTALGLKGIFEDKCLFATAASYLNDASEIEYGCAILEQVLKKWKLKDQRKEKALESAILGNLPQVFDSPQT